MPDQTSPQKHPGDTTAQGTYERLKEQRQPYLIRAWECASLTIPALLPRDGHSHTMELPVPWQGIGARGVNNCASRLLLALFPANTPFFRLRLDDLVVDQIQREQNEESGKNLKTDLEKALAKVERGIMTDFEMSADRVPIFEALKHLLVAGNVLLQQFKDKLRVFSLNRYVVRRDPSGNLLEVICEEEISPMLLPESIRKKAEAKTDYKPEKNVKLYTRACRKKENWYVYQEAEGEKIPGTDGNYPLDKLPFLALRFKTVESEDYGRGFVEEHLGDLRSLEALTKAIVEGSAAASKILFLVKPNGTTKAKVLNDAPNGAVREGNAEDVTCLQMNKQADLQVAKALAQELKADLAYSFLLQSAIQRDAERVTAEEIRFMAEELEQTLGGFYSIMSQELQLPLVTLKMATLQRSRRLPILPKGTVKPTIVTGVEALGRGNDRSKLTNYVKTLSDTVGPNNLGNVINLFEVAERLATADGIDTKNLIITPGERAGQDQQAQIMSLVESLGPNAINQLGGIIQERMKQTNGGQAEPAAQ